MNKGQIYTYGNEGLRLLAYDDATGKIVGINETPQGTLTIGVGHTGFDFKAGDCWTKEQAMTAFDIDYEKAFEIAFQMFPHFRDACEPRQAVLADMSFQMGERGLGKFHNLYRAFNKCDYAAAAEAIRDSLYAHETPSRAKKNADMMEKGIWQ